MQGFLRSAAFAAVLLIDQLAHGWILSTHRRLDLGPRCFAVDPWGRGGGPTRGPLQTRPELALLTRRELALLTLTTGVLAPGPSLAAEGPAAGSAVPTSSKQAIDEAASLVRFGLVEEAKGQFDKATKYYNQAISAAPDYALGYSNRANVAVILGRVDDALRDYDAAVTVSSRPGQFYEGLPDRWLLFLNRATARLALGGDPGACVDDLNKAAALRQRPELVIASNRAQAYERLGNYAMAISDYGSAVGLKPQDPQPFWLRYAACLFEKEADAEALGIARRVKAKFAGEPEVQIVLAALNAKYDPHEAAQLYRGLAPVQRQKYGSKAFLQESLRWPPRLVDAVLDLRVLASS
eukprot:CAMPEP_0172630864 /NCGR_PEP_ID=MMETSP1068-20121228/175923_1 /TAXON_ID=35684 /ORGANISM="Pseudopedinella elastica, Strain CCMP716" /LENGTH=351 /DNA_ID=CAMNT_0013441835 /DNA_START=109 /DNA_END=1164 /DNA_ORIENTATION=-